MPERGDSSGTVQTSPAAKSKGKPFDAATKHLLELDPIGWARLLGAGEQSRAEILDSDLSTVSAAADKVLKLWSPSPWLMHIELQAGYDSEGGWRTLRYKVLLVCREGLPVQSLVVLLRPEADGPAFSGRLESKDQLTGEIDLEFRFRVLRVWEMPVETFLNGPLAALPLAPLANVSKTALPRVIREMERRISAETTRAEADSLWTSTLLLMGLKLPPGEARTLLRGMNHMKESSTYQEILAEGVERGLERGREQGREQGLLAHARLAIRRLGARRFGEPNARTIARLEAIKDCDRLDQILDRILDVDSWTSLLRTK